MVFAILSVLVPSEFVPTVGLLLPETPAVIERRPEAPSIRSPAQGLTLIELCAPHHIQVFQPMSPKAGSRLEMSRYKDLQSNRQRE